MKVSLLKILSDPNNGGRDFSCFGCEVDRNGDALNGLPSSGLNGSDDIKTGIVINNISGYVYPVTNYVLSMFSDNDLEPHLYVSLLQEISKMIPDGMIRNVRDNIKRVQSTELTDTSQWNTEEMGYYDEKVSTDEKRNNFLKNIRSTPMWNIYLERKIHLIDYLNTVAIENEHVLEIGCGNARTVSWIFPPKNNHCNYVGTDISSKRLILARQVVPEGDFVQCSAFNLPFTNASFQVVISFGVLHHLPDPLVGMTSSLSVVKEGGICLIHEPIEKPVVIFDGNRFKRFEKLFEGGYEHSEHDKEINIQSFLAFFKKQNVSVKHIHYSTSALRTILGFFISKLNFLNKSRGAWKLLLWLDSLFIKLLCRKPNVLGPGTVLVVAQKNSVH